MVGYLREVTLEDMDLLFEWANEAEVRRNSFHTDKITWEEHQRWYRSLMQKTDSKQYIYMRDEEAIGQLRITINGEEAEIGYSIDAEQRGRGYGKEMLQLADTQVQKDFPAVKKFTARVKTDNAASCKAFERAGFLNGYVVYEKNLTRRYDKCRD